MAYEQITETIIGGAYRVHAQLGAGFLEKVYENALVIELSKAGLNVRNQVPMNVHYDGQKIGEYFADLVVNNLIVCELKAVETVNREHEMQLVNYLKASNTDVGLLINFGKSVTIKKKFRVFNPVHLEKSC